jgi:hypothetical protein
MKVTPTQIEKAINMYVRNVHKWIDLVKKEIKVFF